MATGDVKYSVVAPGAFGMGPKDPEIRTVWGIGAFLCPKCPNTHVQLTNGAVTIAVILNDKQVADLVNNLQAPPPVQNVKD